jgi:hypothetical protein
MDVDVDEESALIGEEPSEEKLDPIQIQQMQQKLQHIKTILLG